ncbi:MAG TPA: hypothetical protein PKE23_07790 [Anaerolineales bacterium]|nr:hypothetical protein [Anaerolineales bacterium]HMZ07870.1 hypothetical protein [Anaerolineales bacterium]HNB36076.1 hypothetical protein [Anaerolineales bacterium]
MKTVIRILIILVVTGILGGLMYVGVSASNSSTAGFPEFEGERQRPQFGEESEFRPEGGEFRPDGDGDRRGERGGFGFPGGVIKALVLMTIAGGIYSAVTWTGKKAKQAINN